MYKFTSMLFSALIIAGAAKAVVFKNESEKYDATFLVRVGDNDKIADQLKLDPKSAPVNRSLQGLLEDVKKSLKTENEIILVHFSVNNVEGGAVCEPMSVSSNFDVHKADAQELIYTNSETDPNGKCTWASPSK